MQNGDALDRAHAALEPREPQGADPGGEMGALVRTYDWSATPLGPRERWPQSLRSIVAMALSSSFPMVVLWGPQLTQIYNDAYRGILGQKHPGGLGQPTQACWPEIWHINEPLFRRVLRGETVTRENALYPLMRRGYLENAYFTLCYSPLFDEAGAVAGILVNTFETTGQLRATTARDRAEAALRESEARFRHMADNTSVMVWVTADDGSATYLSKTWYVFTGQAPSTALGFGWLDAIHPDDYEATVRTFREATARREEFHKEYRLRRWDGVYRWALDSAMPRFSPAGEFLGYIGSVIDITERKQDELNSQLLLDLDAELNHMADPAEIEQTTVARLGTYLGTTRCFFAHLEGERASVYHEWRGGVPPILGSYRLRDYGPLATLEQLRASRVGVVADVGLDARTARHAARFHALALGAFILAPVIHQGQWVGALIVASQGPRPWRADEVQLVREVAARVWPLLEQAHTRAALEASEARLQALYAQEQAARAHAEEASRLKDEFLALISHELRTPLTTFLGYAQLLRGRRRDDGELVRSLDAMVRSAQAQARIIDELLDVSRIVTGKLRIEPEPIDVVPVINAAIETARPALVAKRLHLQVALEPEAGAVLGDPARLQQVVWNLLANATKFTPVDGTIRVRLARQGHEAVLEISDTGQGISPDFLPFVFERFRQGDSSMTRAQGGLGLGLAIVRSVVELHGGTVQVASPGAGQGASVTVRLPIAAGVPHRAAPLAQVAPVAAQACPPELRGLRVLVVDDEPAILELLHAVLDQCGAVVRQSGSARTGLTLLRLWRPDVLVADIAMPGEDGYWLIHNVRALPADQGGATPAVALTAYGRGDERTRVLAAGFQRFLPKPTDLEELLASVAGLVRARAHGGA